MYMCIYLGMFIRMYCMYVFVCMYVRMYMYVYVCMYMYIRMFICTVCTCCQSFECNGVCEDLIEYLSSHTHANYGFAHMYSIHHM